jgi:hypothetical protein
MKIAMESGMDGKRSEEALKNEELVGPRLMRTTNTLGYLSSQSSFPAQRKETSGRVNSKHLVPVPLRYGFVVWYKPLT